MAPAKRVLFMGLAFPTGRCRARWPTSTPTLGLHLARTAKAASRAFDDALAAAGGSLPQWLILVELKGRTHGTQRTIAQAVGVEGPTLTHHLNKMEAAGLVTRHRDPDNRRVHQSPSPPLATPRSPRS
jgi:MarR family transcriptional regulator for hemolysin